LVADTYGMSNLRRTPVYSLLSTESDLDESIHLFVIGLAEQVDLLQDDEHNSDFEGLEERAVVLAGHADRMGYPDLARVVQKVADSCSEEMKGAVQKGLVQVTEIARCIRLGHRGSA
jgi:hypothetical protein